MLENDVHNIPELINVTKMAAELKTQMMLDLKFTQNIYQQQNSMMRNISTSQLAVLTIDKSNFRI